MKNACLSADVHVAGFSGYNTFERTWKFGTEGISIPGRTLLCGAASPADSCHKLAGRTGCHFPSSAAGARYFSPGVVSLTNSRSARRDVQDLKNNLFPRLELEKSEHFSGFSCSRLTSSRGENERSYRSAEVRPAKSRHAVEGEGYRAAVEEIQKKNQSEGLYRPYADFAVRELARRSDITPLLLKDELRNLVARDGSTVIVNNAFESSKIRYFRSTCIDGGSNLQVLNVAGFARAEYDIPIFCADFFSTADRNIIVLDLNPLYSTSNECYKEKYYDNLLAIASKHLKVLTWGGKVTAESVQFFSPIVIWTKAEGQDLQQTLYPAFQEYLLAWFSIVDAAKPTSDSESIVKNQEAQHRYLTWRATKDPGRPLLTRLYGEKLSETFIEEYLFQGLKTLGAKSFLDYFPQYRTENNNISRHRSMVGKSFSTRPWDEHGNFRID
ncbi:hypothetical protein R1sor_020903 [Riccia sorocarpa]|uniref:Ferredoxin-dependent bilin reductase n=1 Tax=Riccia sorocarpa TaxID=122646 RepID=A0ABD3GIF0_9MARC